MTTKPRNHRLKLGGCLFPTGKAVIQYASTPTAWDDGKPNYGDYRYAPKTQPRNKKTGQYSFEGNWDRLCVCGHRLGAHAGEPPHDCFSGQMDDGGEYCDCPKFRPSRRKV